jgi:hypothetical protein
MDITKIELNPIPKEIIALQKENYQLEKSTNGVKQILSVIVLAVLMITIYITMIQKPKGNED